MAGSYPPFCHCVGVQSHLGVAIVFIWNPHLATPHYARARVPLSDSPETSAAIPQVAAMALTGRGPQQSPEPRAASPGLPRTTAWPLGCCLLVTFHMVL